METPANLTHLIGAGSNCNWGPLYKQVQAKNYVTVSPHTHTHTHTHTSHTHTLHTHTLQCDPAWGSQRLGTSGDTICSAGCAMSSVTMFVAGRGHSFNPSSMNQWLIQHGGYESGDLLYVVNLSVCVCVCVCVVKIQI